MAGKRIRDYKAEERRRNELARQRGYTSRAQERTARRKAKVAAQRGNVSKPVTRPAVGIELLRDERLLARSWSEIHSRKDVSAYRDDFTPKQLKDYLDAFVYESKGKTRKNHIRDYLTENYPDDYPDKNDDEYWTNY